MRNVRGLCISANRLSSASVTIKFKRVNYSLVIKRVMINLIRRGKAAWAEPQSAVGADTDDSGLYLRNWRHVLCEPDFTSSPSRAREPHNNSRALRACHGESRLPAFGGKT